MATAAGVAITAPLTLSPHKTFAPLCGAPARQFPFPVCRVAPPSSSSSDHSPRRRSLRRARRAWGTNPGVKDVEDDDRGDAQEDETPMSLAALSGTRSQLQQRQRVGGPNVKARSAPLSASGDRIQQPRTPPASSSGCSTNITQTAILRGPGLEIAPAHSYENPSSNQSWTMDPEPPRHPPVAFRTAAELRRMLQERQATGPSAAAAGMTTATGASGSTAATAPPVRCLGSPGSPSLGSGQGPDPASDRTDEPDAANTTSSSSTCTGGADGSSSGAVSTGSTVSTSGSDHLVPATAPAGHTPPRAAHPGSGPAGPGASIGGSSGGAWLRRGVGGDAAAADVAAGHQQLGGEGRWGLRGGAAVARGGDRSPSSLGSSRPPTATARSTTAPEPEGLDEDREYQKAKRAALSLLQRSPLPACELSRRLLALGHPQAVVVPLLDSLASGGAINDRIYARLYATSKWNSNLSAPAKIKKELAGQGVCEADVAAALAHVFGPSRRIRLTGEAATQEERDVREALLEGARKHVQQRGRAAPSVAGADTSSASAAAAWAKERNAKRRRLAMWLQYRGHEMDLVVKVFQLLKI